MVKWSAVNYEENKRESAYFPAFPSPLTPRIASHYTLLVQIRDFYCNFSQSLPHKTVLLLPPFNNTFPSCWRSLENCEDIFEKVIIIYHTSLDFLYSVQIYVYIALQFVELTNELHWSHWIEYHLKALSNDASSPRFYQVKERLIIFQNS